MEKRRVPSVSQSISFYIQTSKQQGISAHGASTLKTVAAIGHATESTVLGASAGTGGFEPVIGCVVVNEVFHFRFPFESVAVDAAPGVGDSPPLRGAGHRLQHVLDAVGAALSHVVLCGTNSSRHPPILLIHHVLVHSVASTAQGTQGSAIVLGGLIVLPGHRSSVDIGHYGVLIG